MSVTKEKHMTSNKKKILIVDDEKDTVELLETVLEFEGFEVLKAFQGKMALDSLKKGPDLILLDVMMPGGMDGLEVCKKIRNNPKYSHIPIIIFSSKVLDKDIDKGMEAGADKYITKPFSSKDLIQTINGFLNKEK